MILCRVLFASLLATLISAATCHAAPMQVRGGEHGDFTRLVIAAGVDANWVLGRADDGYELRVRGTEKAFDLSQAFTRLSHERLLAITAPAGGGRLRISVAGGVSVAASTLPDGKIIIDLRTSPPAPNSPFENQLPGLVDDTPGPSQKDVSQDAGPPTYQDGTILFSPGGGQGARLPIYWRDALKVQPVPPVPGPSATEQSEATGSARSVVYDTAQEGTRSRTDHEPGVMAVEMELLRQLGRAASQGLVKVPDPIDRKSLRHRSHPDSIVNVGSAANHVEFRAETTVDETSRDGPEPTPVTSEGSACPDADMTDMTNWGQKDGKPLTLASARSAVMGEFDRPDPKAALRLVHYYMAFGLGVEAQNAIHSFLPQSADADLLADVAGLMDGQAPQGGTHLAALASCDTGIAVWAVLATGKGDGFPDTNFAAVVRAFSGLPVAVRDQIATPLAERLIAAGRYADATAVRNAVVRGDSVSNASVVFLDARINASRGREKEADAGYRSIAGRDDPIGDEAARSALELQIDAGGRIDAALTDHIAALAFEHRKEADGAALASLEIRARSAMGDYPEAFRRLVEVRNEMPNTDFSIATDELFARAARDGDDVVFLRAIYDNASGSGSLGPSARLAVARRLVAEGLGRRAEEVLGTLTETPESRLILAEAALQRFDAKTAKSVILGLDGPAAARLRTRADAMQVSPTNSLLVPSPSLKEAAAGDTDLGKLLRKVGYPEALKYERPAADLSTLTASRAVVSGAQALADNISALLTAAKTPPPAAD